MLDSFNRIIVNRPKKRSRRVQMLLRNLHVHFNAPSIQSIFHEEDRLCRNADYGIQIKVQRGGGGERKRGETKKKKAKARVKKSSEHTPRNVRWSWAQRPGGWPIFNYR